MDRTVWELYRPLPLAIRLKEVRFPDHILVLQMLTAEEETTRPQQFSLG